MKFSSFIVIAAVVAGLGLAVFTVPSVTANNEPHPKAITPQLVTGAPSAAGGLPFWHGPEMGPSTSAKTQQLPLRQGHTSGLSAVASDASSIFQGLPPYDSGGQYALGIAVGDLNGDGNPDVVVVNECASANNCSTSSVSVLLGNGDGTYQSAMSYETGWPQAASVAAEDMNGDGRLDLVVTNFCSSCDNGFVSVFFGNGDGTFQPPVSYAAGAGHAMFLAVGDLNRDGRPDIVTINRCSGTGCGGQSTVGVLLNNGDGTFQSQVSYGSFGYGNAGVAVGDVNGDGIPDVVVANECVGSGCVHGNVSVLLGNGNGTLQAPVTYGTGGKHSWVVALGDFNGDNKLDIVVGNYWAESCTYNPCPAGTVGVLLGNGDGTFQGPVTYDSGGEQPYAVAVGDLNGDGKLDIIVANYYLRGSTKSDDYGAVGVLLGNGDGTFQTALSYNSGGLDAFSVAAADVNGDGHPDLLVTNECGNSSSCTSGTVNVLLGNGNGTFRTPLSYQSGGYTAISVAVGDVNGDGKQDIVVANYCASSTDCTNGTVGVFLSNGDLTFQAPLIYGSGGQGAYSIALGDFNGDGKQDIVVANYCASSTDCTNGSTVGVLLGNGDGTFQPPLTYLTGGQGGFFLSLVVADVNGDGRPDLVVANSSSNTVSLLLGNGDGTFQTPLVFSSGGTTPASIAVGDVNGDGKPDLVVAHYSASGMSVFLGNGDGTFQAPVTYGGQSARFVALGDVNGDGKLDLAVTYFDNNTVGVLLGNGDGTFQAPLTYGSGLNPFSALLGDVNGDGKPDLVVSNCGCSNVLEGSVSVLLGNGDGTFQAPFTYSPGGTVPVSAAFGDINADGKPDVVVANESSNVDNSVGGVAILLNIAKNFHYATTTVATSSLNPALGGQSVTFTATVTPAFNVGEQSGSVTFYDGTNVLGTVTISNGKATVSTSALSLGTHSITAAYAGDTNYLPSTSPVLQETINSSPTTTSLVSSLNPSTFGQSVTFTAIVTPSLGGTPTGTVTFTDGSNVLGVASLSGGQAVLRSSLLEVGGHSIAASYGGDPAYQASTSMALTQTVQMASTALGLTSNTNPSVYNQTVTFTASVTPQFGGSATGTVMFYDFADATPLGTATVSGNRATITFSTLPAERCKIAAVYSGDSNFAGSISHEVLQIVRKASTTIAVNSSQNPAFVGQTIMYTAAVTDQYQGAVSGAVDFMSGTVSLGSAALVNGQASISVSFSKSGTDSIAAKYVADSNHTGSTSSALKQVINMYPSSTTVVSSPNPSTVGEAVTFTATVTSSMGSLPDGENVTFKQGATVMGTGMLSGGTATLSYSALGVGTKAITAVYGGDANFAASKSSALSQVVSQATTTTTLTSSLNPSAVGQPVTFTATVTPEFVGTVTGKVAFYDGTKMLKSVAVSGGAATFTTSTLKSGTHSITATYNGSTSFISSTSVVLTQTVN